MTEMPNDKAGSVVSGSLSPHEILKTYFGFSEFRAGQQQVIEHLLSGQSSAAIFPTGSGKSLCYQLPSLLLPGLTLIVSPLLALMKDQIDALEVKGIPAARLDSTLTNDEYQQTMRDVRDGTIKILYVAPERFMNERFRNAMAGIHISLFAVDEAHCISEWGHNFRPDYLKLPLFAKRLGAKVVLALTATATPQVLLDIQKAFEVRPECAVVTGFYRSNLTLLSQPIEADQKDDQLLSDLRSNPRGPTIIYVTQQKTAEKVANMLAANDIPAKFYHAGIVNNDRVETQNWFIKSDTGIVVATIAFGMGIDKANIRYVYHYNLPKSLENYSQEIGRAGRDGNPAVCKMFACPDDLNTLENFVYGDKPTLKAIRKLINQVFEDEIFDVSLAELSTKLDIKPIVLSTLMTYLELKGFLKAQTPYYQNYQFKCVLPWPEILSKIPTDRHDFLNGILQYSGKKTLWYTLDVDAAMKGLNENRDRIVVALNWMAEKQYIELKSAGIRNAYQILNRPPSIEVVASEIYGDMEIREKKELDRLSRILDWSVLKSCQANSLGAYFGEARHEDCGHCSYCLGDTNRVLPKRQQTEPNRLEEILEQAKELKGSLGKFDVDAVTITRFLCGISSPKLLRTKLNSRHPLFGVLAETPFDVVLGRLEGQGHW